MDEKLVSQLRMLKKYIDVLLKIGKYEKEQYMSDEVLRGAAERYLQLCIETCINIGNRILSIEQFNQKIKAPETYSDIFDNLAAIGVVESDFAEELKKMAKFRNKLVHVYWELDDEYVYELLRNKLSDFIKFLSIIADYLRNKNDIS